ncbi:homeobox protein ceh-30-like protein, partial [Dinothrombium tinctorium]
MAEIRRCCDAKLHCDTRTYPIRSFFIENILRPSNCGDSSVIGAGGRSTNSCCMSSAGYSFAFDNVNGSITQNSDYSDNALQSRESSNGDERKKRSRTSFTAQQIRVLESEFERNKYLPVAKRTQLSKALNLSETQ